jgi:hypothetical protein
VERTFYRAVSFAELADFRTVGHLRAAAGSCEGKHMADALADARRWGEMLHGTRAFAVLRIVADERRVAGWASWTRLDGIGPAHFATIEELDGVVVEEVTDES